jgi:hypothetical protein
LTPFPTGADAVRDAGTDADGYAFATYSLSRACLRQQINLALAQIEVKGTIGSTGLTCWPPGPDGILKSEGEWHITVRDLKRIYYTNEQTGRATLDEEVRLQIRNDLLTIDGRPGPESYNIGQCGAGDNSTGSPEERAEESSWTDEALDDLGDAWKWLRNWLARLVTVAIPIAAAAIVLGALFGAAGLAAGLAAAGIAAVAITLGSIPETENHRLMIESDRYLNNQLILAELEPGNAHRGALEADQNEVREWLLKRLQRVVKEEFIEYNARPYQRYSIHAIRSLYDFARDPAIVMAAQNVLDLASAKMALGSSQGRRLVPFRRLMEVTQKFIDNNQSLDEKGHRVFNGLFDLTGGADHQIGAMLLYRGQTQQTPNGKLSYGAASEMVYIANSRYRPPEAAVDLLIDKGAAYQQRFKHHGVEIYSATPGFLLTAGGIRSPPAYTIEIAGISPGGSILGIIPLSNNKDRGAAVPTTLMLTADPHRSDLEGFLRILGRREALDSDNATYDHNLCVWRGFACGINLRAPAGMDFVSGPPGTPPGWSFFDSRSVAAYATGPQVMIARYTVDCGGDQTGDCTDNIGLFEAVSEPGVSFDSFRQRILTANPAPGNWLGLIGGPIGANRTVLSGTYTSFSGEAIVFDTSAHQRNGDKTGIASVDGVAQADLDDWPRASGDVMTGDHEGSFSFRNPATGHGFIIDMQGWKTPARTDF